MMLIQMSRDGHLVDVHPAMVADYFAGGYREVENAIQAETETEAEAPVKRRGRPRKVAD